MVRTLRIMVATFLLLAAGNVLALGLGQIEVKSRINQPLLAEIPIISTTPGELEALQARLASPETFRRVGLAQPQGIAAELQFSLGNDARGRPVIRVTTSAPVNQAVLNFLIEVDWGQGRLVREYSALIDAPRTASAPLQPAITAPIVAAPNVVQRPATPPPVVAEALPPVRSAPQPVVAAPLPPPTPRTIAPAPMPQSTPAVEPAPPSVAIAPPPPPRPPAKVAPVPASATPAPASSVAATQYGPVKAGETLSKIAGGLDRSGAYTLDQTMLALLRTNPDAFLGDNVNRLKQGAILRIPGSDDRARVDADEAQLVVRQQMQQWRQARPAVTQPDTSVAGNVRSRAPATAAAPNASPSMQKPAATARRVQVPGARQARARLEIVPASAPGKATGTRSGTTAGGEGSMLQQQLQQRDEDLAARKAEIGELKERVAELERLKQQQAQLLTMKDSELAAAQQRLADSRIAASTPAIVTAATTPTVAPAGPGAAQAMQPVPEPQSRTPKMPPWLWIGLAILVIAVLAWLLRRRRRSPTVPASRRSFDSEALAASLRTPAASATAAVQDPSVAADGPVAEAGGQVIDIAEIPVTLTPPRETPTWHSGGLVKSDPAPAAPASLAPRFVPGDALPAAEPSHTDAPATVPPTAGQRIRLARAFLDIGDEHSARQLLRELVVDADPGARAEAAKLLRELD